jgi:hypothetical protein
METERLAGVALVAAVLLAGCGGAEPARETPTLTGAPLPSTEEPAGPGTLAPGLTTDGTLRPAELVAAHSRRLANTTYTIRTNRTVREASRLVSRSETSLRIGPARERYRYTSEFVRFGPDGRQVARTRIEVFTDGERTYRKLVQNRSAGRNTSTVLRVRTSEVLPFELTYDRALFSLFADSEVTSVDRVPGGGATSYTVSHELDRVQVYSFADEATLTTVVRADGLVEQYRVDYTVTVDEPVRRVAWRVRFTDLGTTRVEAPPWYPVATETRDETDPPADRPTRVTTDAPA